MPLPLVKSHYDASPAPRVRTMFLMPTFKIHRLRDSHFQQFRWSPHTAGPSQVRPRDYSEGGVIEADGAYDAWAALRDSPEPLRVGDLLEDASGALRICKYVGFEEARWEVPEPKPEPGPAGSEPALPPTAPPAP